MNYSFIIERIIFYHSYETKNEIINLLQTDSLHYFNYLLFSGDLYNNYNTQILNLYCQNSVKNNIIIEKLKDFIDFEIYKNKLISETNNTDLNYNMNEEEIILIRKDSLNKIGYYSIIGIINKYLQAFGKDNFKDSNLLNKN